MCVCGLLVFVSYIGGSKQPKRSNRSTWIYKAQAGQTLASLQQTDVIGQIPVQK